jgi:hypothetical protein
MYLITGFDDVIDSGDSIGIRDGNLTSIYDMTASVCNRKLAHNESERRRKVEVGRETGRYFCLV